MEKKRLVLSLLLPAMFMLVSYHVQAQDAGTRSQEENSRLDSLADAYKQKDMAEDERRQDTDVISNLKSEKRETKAKAREAQRVEEEASDAARESKSAYRKEKKAQKSREQADKQSKKAAKARAVSDQN